MQLTEILRRDREFDLQTYEVRALVINGKPMCAPPPFDFRAMHERHSLLSIRAKNNLAYRQFVQPDAATVRISVPRDFYGEALATKYRLLRERRRLTVYWY